MREDITELNLRGGVLHAYNNSVWIPPEDLIKSEIDKNVALIAESKAKIQLYESMKKYFDKECQNNDTSRSAQIAMRAAGILGGDILD